MTKRETDTSASDADGDPASETGRAPPADETTDRDAPSTDGSTDPDALFDRLVEENVLSVGGDGGVHTTEAFDHGHGVYYDSYVGSADDEFYEAVAATFGLPDAESAARAVESRGITREDLARYLALRAELPEDVSADDLAVMAEMVGEAVPDSPVPPEVREVTDDPESFLDGRDRAVVTVWKRFCDPCELLKDDLGVVLDAVPDGVAVAGVDGEVAREFCDTYEVDAAPAVVGLRDGEFRTVTGSDTDEVVATLRDFLSS